MFIEYIFNYAKLLFVFYSVGIILLSQKWMIYNFKVNLPFLFCQQVQAIELFKVTEEVGWLKPGGFETLSHKDLMHDSQIAKISEAISGANHRLLNQFLATALHQVYCPLLEVLVAKAERVDLENDICECGLLQVAQLRKELKHLWLKVESILHEGHLVLEE